MIYEQKKSWSSSRMVRSSWRQSCTAGGSIFHSANGPEPLSRKPCGIWHSGLTFWFWYQPWCLFCLAVTYLPVVVDVKLFFFQLTQFGLKTYFVVVRNTLMDKICSLAAQIWRKCVLEEVPRELHRPVVRDHFDQLRYIEILDQVTVEQLDGWFEESLFFAGKNALNEYQKRLSKTSKDLLECRIQIDREQCGEKLFPHFGWVFWVFHAIVCSQLVVFEVVNKYFQGLFMLFYLETIA